MLLSIVLFLPVALCCIVDPGTPSYTIGREILQAASQAADAALSREEDVFLSVPTNGSARASLKHITSKPHVAGTPGDLEMAQYVQSRFLDAGIKDVVIDPQKVLLAYPVERSLSLVDAVGKEVWKAPLAEKVLNSDATSDTWWRNHTFNGYSPSGHATAPIVYANFGLPEDFKELEDAGVSVKGAVALMRYGKCFRGLKAKNAQEAGAVAALIYSDPEQDGYAQGSVYPSGPWRPASSVQRGSIQFISTCAGDPARAYSPHGLDVEKVCGYTQEELIPKIPVLPVSYGDALPLLKSLGGEVAPPSFQGALNLTYRTGPSTLRASVNVHNHFQKSPVWNVIARIPGSLPSDHDHPVILGNHRDAWVYGAADPNSGTAQMLEVAHGLGALLKTGWRPLRTLILCSWSGEEYGLLGSTAWGEVHGDSSSGALGTTGFLSKALAYLNVDTGVSGTHFGASGTPSLGRVLAGVLGHVQDPVTKKPISETWAEGELHALGSGSDYTVFIDHLGIPTLDLAFSPANAQYGVYHSVYDSFAWMDTVGDPGFHYHVTMSQIWGLVALRLAGTTNQPIMPLPLDFSLQADAIKGYIVDAQKNLNKTTRSYLDFGSLETAQESFSEAARKLAIEVRGAMEELPTASRDSRITAINDRIAAVERKFLTEKGLPGRKWFRHVLQAPGLYTGYAAKTLPGIYEAIGAGQWRVAQSQITAAATRIQAAADFLVRGTVEDMQPLVV